ncbi:MAG: hypothetical protein VB034_01095 [Eubacteriales bacterium]|nr:hypothetical protein [Eubacteriales bacterium]
MPVHPYHCVNCGASLTPEDIVYDVSAIAFFGALQGDYSQLPIYMTADEFAQRFTWNGEGEGTCNMTLMDWISLLYEQCKDQLDPGTRRENAEAAYTRYHELLKKQKEDEQYSYSSYQIAIIPGLQDNLSRVLAGNCANEEKCCCTVRMDSQYGYTIVDYAGRDNSTSFTDQRRCRECHSALLDRAFQCEQTLIGFIGFQKVGKTCLIAALCKYLDNHASGSMILLRPSDERSFIREIQRYNNGFSLKKTATDGLLKINPTVFIQGGRRADRMLTFVDIAGEAFNNEDGRFDPSMMENNFRAIADCSLYIFCTSLSALVTVEFGRMGKSLDNFIKHLSRHADRSRPSPMMLAVMQVDETTKCVMNEREAPYIDEEYLYIREYDQIYNILENEQLKKEIPNKCDQEAITAQLRKLLTNIGSSLYYTPITCSAYGRQPVQQVTVYRDSDAIRREIGLLIRCRRPVQIVVCEITDDRKPGDATLFDLYVERYGADSDLVEIINREPSEQEKQLYRDAASKRDDKLLNELREAMESTDGSVYNASALRFTPQPRNMPYLYEWILRMIGELEIPSRTKENAVLPGMPCLKLSKTEYHEDADEVRAIARMFANPHKYDREYYRILNKPKPIAAVKKYLVQKEIRQEIASGGPIGG